jgi:hypothetical protein
MLPDSQISRRLHNSSRALDFNENPVPQKGGAEDNRDLIAGTMSCKLTLSRSSKTREDNIHSFSQAGKSRA